MEVNDNFRLSGFERKNFGLGGMAFYKYEETKKSEENPTISHYYGEEYRVRLPKPAEKRVTGAVLIFRHSKNRYSVTIATEKLIYPFQAESLTQIEQKVFPSYIQHPGQDLHKKEGLARILV